MRHRIHLLAILAAAAPPAASAQQPDPNEVGVVRAAAEYYRDIRLKGPIVLDPTWRLFRGPLVREVVVDAVTQATQVTRGQIAEHLKCREELVDEKKEQVCEMSGGAKAVIAFMNLIIRNDTATLTAVYRKAPVQGRSEGVEEVLTLVKSAGETWRVERAHEVGVS